MHHPRTHGPLAKMKSQVGHGKEVANAFQKWPTKHLCPNVSCGSYVAMKYERINVRNNGKYGHSFTTATDLYLSHHVAMV